MMVSKIVLLPIANGVEEIEAVTIADILRRSGVLVRVSTIEEREISGANGVKIVADSDFLDETLEDFDAIVLPGGTEAAKRFAAHEKLGSAIKNFCAKKNLVGAICASPALVLAHLGVINDKKATCYPSFKHLLKNYVDRPVVEDDNIITSQAPGTAMPFALRLSEILAGQTAMHNVKKGILAS